MLCGAHIKTYVNSTVHHVCCPVFMNADFATHCHYKSQTPVLLFEYDKNIPYFLTRNSAFESETSGSMTVILDLKSVTYFIGGLGAELVIGDSFSEYFT